MATYALNDELESVWRFVTPYHANYTIDDAMSASSRWTLTMTRLKKQNAALRLLPFAQLNRSHHDVFASALYALLHTDAVLSTVVWVIQCRAIKLLAARGEGDAAEEGERKKNRVEEAAALKAELPDVPEQLARHAAAVLYQLAQHAALVTVESSSALARESGSASPTAVADFRSRFVSSTSFTSESIQKLLPCPEVCSITSNATSLSSVMKLLLIPITTFNLAILSRKQIVVEKPMTTIEAIRVLRNSARDDREAKIKKWASQKAASDSSPEPPLVEETADINGLAYVLQVLGGDEADSNFDASKNVGAQPCFRGITVSTIERFFFTSRHSESLPVTFDS